MWEGKKDIRQKTCIIAGTTMLKISKRIGGILNIKVLETIVKKWGNTEISVFLPKEVENTEKAIVMQSIINPVNDSLVELFFIIDLLRQKKVKNITAIIPYFGYSRHDKEDVGSLKSMSLNTIIEILLNLSVTKIITLDLHSASNQKYEAILYNLEISNIYSDLIKSKILSPHYYNIDNLVIISPDNGGKNRAFKVAETLNLPFAYATKKRSGNEVKITSISKNIENSKCIIIDDIIDSGRTLCEIASFLSEYNAKIVDIYITHWVIQGKSHYIKSIESLLNVITTTNSIGDAIYDTKNEKIANIPKIYPIEKILVSEIAKIFID